MKNWEVKFAVQMAKSQDQNSAHDVLHLERVVNTAKQLCVEQGADHNVVVPAAWLHDFVIVPKNDPLRSQASRMAAKAALEYLHAVGYPAQFCPAIAHAIESHSFSAKIAPETLEAKIVQDADRLDALGAIGIARCFVTGGILNRSIYRKEDPLCEARDPEDYLYTVDHFYQKLLLIPDSLQTASGRAEGQRRIVVMKEFLQQLAREIAPPKAQQ